jgi:hypothetical protein
MNFYSLKIIWLLLTLISKMLNQLTQRLEKAYKKPLLWLLILQLLDNKLKLNTYQTKKLKMLREN